MERTQQEKGRAFVGWSNVRFLLHRKMDDVLIPFERYLLKLEKTKESKEKKVIHSSFSYSAIAEKPTRKKSEKA